MALPVFALRVARGVGFTLVAAIAVLMPASCLFAQVQPQLKRPPQQQPKISVETKLVRVFATVRDKHGKVVPDLARADFALGEDGRPQTITYFARENDLPLSVGLLVDTSLSQRTVLDDERSASYTFFDQILRPSRDQAFVIHFDREVELLQDLTPSRDKLEAALKLLQTPERPEETSDGGRPDFRHGGGGTLLYDAIYLASREEMQKLQGSKAIIVLSDGGDRGSKENLQEAVEAAQRADTVVYSILFKGQQPSERRSRGGFGGVWGGYRGGGGGQRRFPQQEERPDGKKVLQTISQLTGGRMFEVSKKLPIGQIYSQIAEELRNQYILGYVPDKMQSDVAYHNIHVVTTKKGLVVQARDGYFSTP